MTDIKTKEFLRSSLFSQTIRQILKSLIIPLAAEDNKAPYQEQFNEASRNAEITLEGLLRLTTRHPLKTAYVLRAVHSWLWHYYKAQRTTHHQEKYFIYTQFDEEIPFLPGEDIMYAYMISQIAYVANELAILLPAKEMKYVAASFMDLNHLGAETFNQYPTLMPRHLQHQRISLKVIQKLDQPVNCCPSLHIAYSLFLDNLGEKIISLKHRKKEVFDSIRYSTIRMFNSVLYVKQHSLLDIAFGMLCAKIIFEQRFNHKFNDFTAVFDDLKPQHPLINYNEIKKIYDEALSLYANHGFAETVGCYLENHGYLKVRTEDISGKHVYFDTTLKQLVFQP